MTPELLRAWWADRQGLLEESATGKADVLAKAGWARSVGGCNPYLTLFARVRASREEVDRAVAACEIHELPAARGCTYVVPKADFALALKLSQGQGEPPETGMAKRYLGVTDEELERLRGNVLEALKDGPLDPAALKQVLGDAVRNLGAEGKKRGVTTTLPLALGRLQSAGRIRRQPVGGRLDQQRYAYALWPDNPLDGQTLTPEEALAGLAQRYFRWIGPASLAHFQWFSGLGVKAAKAVADPLGLVPLEPGSNLLLFPEDREALLGFTVPKEPVYRLVGGMDGLFLHRREVVPLLDPQDLNRQATGSKSVYEIGSVQELSNNAILDRGRIVGLWEYDVETASIVWWSFVEPSEAMRAEIAKTEAYVRDQLGDARSFSLDSPASRKPLIEALRRSGEAMLAASG